MRFAYADPPYYGHAAFYDHPDSLKYNTLEAHADLIEDLSEQFPDGWALSLTSPNLKDILPLCPRDVRVMAWVKPFASYKPGINPAYAWEPVIVRGGRPRTDRTERTVRDWVSVGITLEKGLVGAKPYQFCRWVLEVLGYRPDQDEIVDLFPGTGIMDIVSGNQPLQTGLFAE